MLTKSKLKRLLIGLLLLIWNFTQVSGIINISPFGNALTYDNPVQSGTDKMAVAWFPRLTPYLKGLESIKPVLSNIETEGINYTEKINVTSTIEVNDEDNTSLQSATISIAGFVKDQDI
ncbi:MAG TPA: hypothetical protein VHO90_13590, partial [Bacteroidales bacterium]|nr:hypothetical protein [Bacteroidales bacterium]